MGDKYYHVFYLAFRGEVVGDIETEIGKPLLFNKCYYAAIHAVRPTYDEDHNQVVRTLIAVINPIVTENLLQNTKSATKQNGICCLRESDYVSVSFSGLYFNSSLIKEKLLAVLK